MILLFFVVVPSLLVLINFVYFLFTGRMIHRTGQRQNVSLGNEGILDAPTVTGQEKVDLPQEEDVSGASLLTDKPPIRPYRPDFLWFLLLGGIHLVLYPVFYLAYADIGKENDCCAMEPALLSPDHKGIVYLLYFLSVAAYFYSSIRTKLGPPLLEVVVDCLMILGFVLNGFIAYQINNLGFVLLGNLSPAMLFLLRLSYNHLLIVRRFSALPDNRRKWPERMALRVLRLAPFQKYPLLMVLCLPFLALLVILLMLFGQRPDALVQAFTDTYKHGFSQMDCTGVVCPDEHFLCTIAAKGHKRWVKPLRMGVRQGWPIEVNRQLLVSNAFEELMEEKIPFLHRPIRKTYNIVGRRCKAVYKVLGNQWVSDVVYVLMKPLEYFFVVVLYLFDTKPENRIARQYLSAKDRARLAAGRGA